MKNKKVHNISFIITCLIIAMLLNIAVFGQDKENLSERQLIFLRNEIDSLNKLAFKIFSTNPLKTRSIAIKSHALASAVGYQKGEGKANNYIGMSYHITGSYDTAILYYEKALNIFEMAGDTLNTGKIYNNLALLFSHREYYNLALEYNLKSLRYAELMHDDESIFHNYNNMGSTYEKLEQYDNALKAYNECLNILGEDTTQKKLYSYAICNIAIINLLTKQYDSVEQQLQKSLHFFLSEQDNYGISQAYKYLGQYYTERKDIDKALEAIENSNKYGKIIENKKITIENQFQKAYLQFLLHNTAQAKLLFKESLQESKNANYLKITIESFKYLSKIDSLNSNYFGALKNYQAYMHLKDSANSLKIQNQIAELNIRYESLQKNKEIANLTAEKELHKLKIKKQLSQRNLLLLLIVGILSIGAIILNSRRKIRKKNTLLAEKNEEIGKKNKELHDHKQHLEEKVKERTSELLKAKNKAEESDRLKTAFLANISHEIRTPMTGIIGFASLLKEEGLSGKEQAQYIKIIERSGKRMLNIITELVDISKIEAGQVHTNKCLTNINEQMQYLYQFFAPDAAEKGLEFSYTEAATSSKSWLITDQGKFIAIMSNLLKNALKYTFTGSIQFGYTILFKEKSISQWQFYVKDSGIGIPKQRQEAIFERFVQADIEDVNAYEGAGLGLAISKAYVEMLDGRIWVVSEEGNGSTFYVTLPHQLIEKEIPSTIETKQLPSNKNKAISLKVLIAEDDETSILHFNIILKEIAHEIIYATTGKEAVEQYQQHPDIDLVLMDIKMPVMDGYTASREIRKLNKDVFIIGQTAHALAGDREKCIDAGCNEYITKPLDKTILLNMLRNHFNEIKEKDG